MAKLTSPMISVTFTEMGISAITRGDKGTVALIVRDEAEQVPFAITQGTQTPETLGKETQDYIKRTFLGYVNPPKKVIVYVLGADGRLADALDYMAAQVFDYICGPADCTNEEAADIAGWVKSQRQNNGAKFKAVLPNYKADHYSIVNFTGDAMTDGTTVWATAEYCSRIAGLLAGTPMKIAATYAPLPELTDCARLTREEADEAVGSGELSLKWDGRKVKLNRAVDYVGKFANSYDNKLLLITAIRGYFMELARPTVNLVQPGYTVDIDVEAQEAYLMSRGTNTEEMSEQQIREADTGSHVFLVIRCKILDAMEDIIINVLI